MKAHSSSHLTSIWPVRVALAAAFLASTACGSGDDNTAPPTDSGSDSTTTTTDAGADAGKDTGTTPETSTTTPDTGAADTGASDGGGAADGGGEAGPLTFTADVYPIIAAHCAGCHGVGNIPPADAGLDATNGNGFNFGHLDMGDASAAWTSLVGDGGVPAQGVGPVPNQDAGETCGTLGAAGLLRVAADDAGGSLLANKVAAKEDSGAPAVFCGNPMPNPPTAPAISESDLGVIMSWISEGAKP
jgi:hypothetical protein